jgi:hypothetical protein
LYAKLMWALTIMTRSNLGSYADTGVAGMDLHFKVKRSQEHP